MGSLNKGNASIKLALDTPERQEIAATLIAKSEKSFNLPGIRAKTACTVRIPDEAGAT